MHSVPQEIPKSNQYRVGGPVHVSAHRTAINNPERNWPHLDQENRDPAVNRESSPCYTIAPCPNYFVIKEEYAGGEQIAPNVYRTTPHDNETSFSQEDHKFLEIMSRTAHKNSQGNWEMLLPFHKSDVVMPNNRSQAVNRLNGLLCSFKRNTHLERDYLAFMGKILERGHETQVPPDQLRPADGSRQVWYLPHFAVYHPRKPDQIRVVFYSSAECHGMSLNKELLSGPNQINSLLGVLVRFRQENVALLCDVEQMFHSFYVNPEHRDYLRFLWFKDTP